MIDVVKLLANPLCMVSSLLWAGLYLVSGNEQDAFIAIFTAIVVTWGKD